MPTLNCTYFLQNFISISTHHVISVFSMVVLAIVVLKTYKEFSARAGIAFIIAGGLHNLYMRIRHTCVTDNINFFNLFMFNLADLCITIGVVLVLWRVFIYEQKNSNN